MILYGSREIVNAIRYQARTGCQWRYLPHDLPPKSAVYYYFGKWRDDGTAETIHDLLRAQVRESRKRQEDPTAVVLDTQTVRASTNAPKETTGLDPGKKSPGRKRGIATDVLGLVIAVVVVAASVHDNAIGITLLDKVVQAAPAVTKAWVDAGFKNAVVEHGANHGIDVEIVQRQPGVRGFAPEPKRWVVEQTLGTLMLHRRLTRDFETKPASSVAMIHWSMTDVMLRRLTRTSTPSWRDPPAWRAAPQDPQEHR
ncbi:IS5 family transposase [Streptomyces sp. NPDC001793]|uniref:IS5 family transposase n=1 Tax=Streptomyces sp. NPDC001793 TaxID=3154657 RepID=UPI00331FDCA7